MSENYGFPALHWVAEKATIEIPIQVAQVELTDSEVEAAIIQYARSKYGLRDDDAVSLAAGNISWKSSEFIVIITRDED